MATVKAANFIDFLSPFRWLIYVFNSVVDTKLPTIISHRRNTTVSLETYPFIHLSNFETESFMIN